MITAPNALSIDMMDDSTELIGRLLKVVSVDLDTMNVHARGADGQTTRFTVLQGNLPSRGDVILLGADRWELAPHEAWPVYNNIATVRAVLDESSLLIDDGITIKPISNCRMLPVEVHNTIEYNEIDGVIRVVAESPIRSRDYGTSRDDIIKDYLIGASTVGPTFSDFGGYPEVVARARELVETQLNRRQLLDEIGARPVRGILFSGPPGTGKTHLARIISYESKADFFLVSGPSIVSKWVGDTEDTLRKIFDAAASSESGRAIIFFDEIDSIAESRSGETHEASKRLVAQLLTLMDGFADKAASVVVIAATNRVDALDPALTRPGRFDWEIEFGLPTLIDRLDILKVGMRGIRCSENLPIIEVAVRTHDWSAARLASLWTEAALIAAADGRSSIAGEDFARAFERVARRPDRTDPKGGGR